jgi:GT2 family glycosyltransferase
MADQPDVWAVVPCFNRTVSTLRFLKTFRSQDYRNKHVVIVDDGSSDHTGFNVRLNFPEAHLVTGDGDLWWAGATNLGIRYALAQGADFIFTVNDDSKLASDLVSVLVQTARFDERFIVGSVIVEEDNEDVIWSVGAAKDFSTSRLMRLNLAGENVDVLRSLPDPYPVEFMPGNGVLLPRRVFERVGYYDEVNFPQYHADSELVLRAARLGCFTPVINLRARVVNQILRRPLVCNVRDLVFNKRSDLYWPALSTLVLRYYPEADLAECFDKLYGPFSRDVLIGAALDGGNI